MTIFLLRKARFFIMDQLLDIVSIVGELNDTFDINITPVDIVPENFNSAEAMWDMIQRLSE